MVLFILVYTWQNWSKKQSTNQKFSFGPIVFTDQMGWTRWKWNNNTANHDV